YVLGVEASNGARQVVLYLRAGKDSPEAGTLLAQKELSSAGNNTGLRFTLDGARAQAWFSPRPGQWQRIGEALDASL
ncbi:hypothetical protein Q0P46_14600, partial [Staphylococcus aureus]|nr:hypothetical protein [Staphylococcus aureus]